MYTLIVIVQVVSALAIIGLVLLQHGKGADMGAAFGSGASGSLFGATGSSNFLSKSTGFAAAIFFTATLMLAYLGNNRSAAVGGGVMDKLPKASATMPAKSATTPPPTGSAAIPGPTSQAPASIAPAVPEPLAPAAGGAQPGATGVGQSSEIPK